VLISLLFLWITLRSRATDESRTTTAVALLTVSIAFQPFVAGIPLLSFDTNFGRSEALFTWILFALATLELVLRRKKPKAEKKSQYILYAALTFWFLGLIMGLYQKVVFSPSFFYVPVGLIIYFLVSPGPRSINAVNSIFSIAIFINFMFAVLRFDFQANTSTTKSAALTTETVAYQNQAWLLFGNFDRYQGPFAHPNTLGTYIGIMVLVLTATKRKKYAPIVVMGWILLLLTSSRGSLLATFTGVAVVYLSALNNSKLKNALGKATLAQLSILLSIPFFLNLVQENQTLTGRTILWKRYIDLWRESPLIGNGIYLNSVESSYIWALASTGILGLLLLFTVFSSAYVSLPKTVTNQNALSIGIFVWLLIRCAGDAIYTFSGWDTGMLAFLLIFMMTNNRQWAEDFSDHQNHRTKK
jgi:hypothetical protein